MKKFALSSVFILTCSLAAWAGPELSGVRWQYSPGLKPAVKHKFSDAQEIKIPVDGKMQGLLRAMVSLENKTGKDSGGIVLRVAVSARLIRAASPEQPGVWDLPFWIDERRVAELKAGAKKEAPIPNIDLQKYLKRMQKTGYWIDALKIQLAVEPRAGEDFGSNMSEALLNVTR
ncbi:MAG TPA: hypothetical protein PLL10_00665 [Elusimicrobiales bacterium]|nr:hypothetical protein [Elusimicrobiales bacterium]